ncbi:MAG: twin-arginine translocation signal domain-containing protein, partial [Cytophagales bacterium]
MNNQITRRNLLKLLGVSGVALPLSGISKDLEIQTNSIRQAG